MRLILLANLLMSCPLFLSSSVTPNPPIDPPTATALLNDSTWFGKARALRHEFKYNRPCMQKQFQLSIMTDIPHSRGYYDRKAPITGCMDKCLPTQLFGIVGIPLKVGKYKLPELQRCYGGGLPASYVLIDGGDVSAGDFYGQEGWVEVTVYKPANRQLEGKFEATVRSNQGEVVHLTKGVFKAKLVIEP